MNHSISLNEIQIENIRKLAGDERRKLGFIGETPIANDIFTILENMNILLLEYPIKSDDVKPAFSAALMCSTEGDKELVFIGLNTADFFDKQIFAIVHELYHFYTKTGSHLSRLSEEENSYVEAEANRFAAEFLLPESTLKSIVLDEFKTSSLRKIQTKMLLRFIARLQCVWWLPYRSLVKRLREIDAVSDEQYERLYNIDERDLDGEYGRMGKAINKEVFVKLNTATNNIGTSPKDIEIIIRNFEDGIIDEDKFINTLNLFNKKPDDFGYKFEVSDEDIDEFEEFFNEEG
ncbi:ImmA/IrrE family metallo-endopeptidase [Petroclostridium sp. X23]|uniref:ImmA/IrrE family metallo-endopeptidase n=1 Tax=Petroclostridium sp. X23 TaxID=3045146 RepID=UPI0024AE5586|nr:ImmA/IrrE family metallo-endopeptidase [Petroclostridium sp. X23]WHH59763.1 ImmA/IrrE family metallo-endopeptidase [Petroclostridium sp. X23]